MRKVDWGDKLIIDKLKAEGDIFGYLGGALQYEEDFGVDWRQVFSEAVSKHPINSTIFDPTVVEPEIFGITIEGWDERKRKLKREMATGSQKAEDEYYRNMSRVVHLDLYALGESHYAVIRLSKQRTHGTTEEYVEYVLKTYKRPTFVFYDDAPEDYSDWMKQRGLEGKREHYNCYKDFPTIKTIVRFLREHKEDIIQWDKNRNRTMDVIRRWRALCRDLRWNNIRKIFPSVSEEVDAKLRETYKLLQKAKKHLQECESIKAVEEANKVAKQITQIKRMTRRQRKR